MVARAGRKLIPIYVIVKSYFRKSASTHLLRHGRSGQSVITDSCAGDQDVAMGITPRGWAGMTNLRTILGQ